MKKKNIFNLTLLFSCVLLLSTSCSDMLTPDLERYSEKNGQDSIYSYLGILKSMQKIADRTVILGEARGDLVSSTKYLSDSVSHLYNFDEMHDGDNAMLQCADYYNVINQCNFYLHYVDTANVKDEVKYMQKEWAQVQAVRAWTYMQLVENYGEVPFFTEPVSSSSLGQSIAKNGSKANRKNLYTLLSEAGLERAYELQELYGDPYYGNYNTGSSTIDSRACFFPVGLVRADLCLLADDYSKAAEYYYDYIRKHANTSSDVRATFIESIQRDGNRYIPNTGQWTSKLFSYYRSTNGELITLIPSAASKNNGEVLTSVQNVYGYKTSISSSGGGSGSVSVHPDETYRQLMPSENYIGLNAEQVYCNYRSSGGTDVQEYYDGVGDARVWACAPYYKDSKGDEFRFITKRIRLNATSYDWMSRKQYAFGFSNYYGIPVYRKSLVYLRFAEAINRAGFPEHAFSILKDGLASDNFPTVYYKDSIDYKLGEDSDTLSIDTIKDVPYLRAPEANAGGAYYISLSEMLKAKTVPYLDFQDSKFNSAIAYGIHSFGSGDTRGYHDTLYSYNICVAQKIAASRLEAGNISESESAVLADSLTRVGIDKAVSNGTITSDEVTNAVEDLIIDELALETAYEGNRYYDLMRFASHKGGGSIDNEWLARRIASRDYAPGKGFDQTLYNRIVGGTRWYLPLPEE